MLRPCRVEVCPHCRRTLFERLAIHLVDQCQPSSGRVENSRASPSSPRPTKSTAWCEIHCRAWSCATFHHRPRRSQLSSTTNTSAWCKVGRSGMDWCRRAPSASSSPVRSVIPGWRCWWFCPSVSCRSLKTRPAFFCLGTVLSAAAPKERNDSPASISTQ